MSQNNFRRKTIAVFGSARAGEKSGEYRAAREIGRLIGKAGWEILCGGYGGVMEAVCRGGREAGGTCRGIGLEYFTQAPNPHLRSFEQARTLGERLDYFIAHCDLFLSLEGGIGTVAEAMFVWDLIKGGQLPQTPLLLYGRGWEKLLAALKENFLVDPAAFDLPTIISHPSELSPHLAPSP